MRKILVIEDTPEILDNIFEFLEAEDFEVMTATNGRIGLELARQNQFDLILCDIMMPEMDGYAVISQLRQDPVTADIPFIFLTAKGERSDLRLGMNLGADDYLTKPFTPDELLTAITARLDRLMPQAEKLRQVSEQLEHLENFDALTGLPNLSTLQGDNGYFCQAIAKTDKIRRLVPFLLLGLDRFGRINDTLGYANGNLLLQQFAQRLVNFIQKIQTAGVVRLSGDEFAVILPPVNDQEIAVAIAQDLLKLIAQPFYLNGRAILLTSSIGIAFYPLATSLEELQRQASIAMGSAKQKGGNFCTIYNPPIFGHEAAQELQLAADLHQAWEQKNLQVFYQPRIDLKTRKLVAVEAVIYWKHPIKGAISLAKTMAVAEEAGLTILLNEWVLQSACQQARIWQNSGNTLRVAVTIHDQWFTDKNLTETILRTCQSFGLKPDALEIAIAADTIAKSPNINATALKLKTWQNQGIQTTISKFGMTHTSLDYLGQLALNNLKIDRSLALNSPQNIPILNAIVEMGHRLKFRVVAEGVATEAQATFLKKQKCDEIQEEEALPANKIQRNSFGWLTGHSFKPLSQFF